MQKQTIDELFDDLKGDFDIHVINHGHEKRFAEKLIAKILPEGTEPKSFNLNWRPLMAIAASLIICFSMFIALNHQPEVLDLANVSPELEETQDFFTVTIENELRKLNQEKTPFTEHIISDAMLEIYGLERDYNNLKVKLTESGEDQRVIYAMISNFQSRIDLLQTVLEEIETIKQLKTSTDETKNTL